MKSFFKIILIILPFIGLMSCDKEEPYVVPALEVTYANIEGVWKLAQWNNQAVSEDTYLYIVFNRRERTYEIYQKFDSMYSRYITGSYKIEEDDELGAILSGRYDHGMGSWNNSYFVTDLYKDSMNWTVKDNTDDVSHYIRIENVPSEVIEESQR